MPLLKADRCATYFFMLCHVFPFCTRIKGGSKWLLSKFTESFVSLEEKLA